MHSLQVLIILLAGFSMLTPGEASKFKNCTASCKRDIKKLKICKRVQDCTRIRCSLSKTTRKTKTDCCADSDCKSIAYKCVAKKCAKTGAAQAIADAFESNVPAIILKEFPDRVMLQIIDDSPTGFVPGRFTVGSMNEDLSDTPMDGETSFMTFAVKGLGDSLIIDGVFVPAQPLTTVPDGTVVKVYAQDGLRATSKVDVATGYARIGITGFPPGAIPILFTFSSPLYNGLFKNIRSLQVSPSLTYAYSTPASAYVQNPNSCPPSLTFTLSWNGPTSDIDLHVFEPSGLEVFYGMKNGNEGSLDVDDVDGYGPENYYSSSATPGQTFRAQIDRFAMNCDTFVTWNLEARMKGVVLWRETGSFDTSGSRRSPMFSVVIANDRRQLQQSTCPNSSRRLQESSTCTDTQCCPPSLKKNFFCLQECEANNAKAIEVYDLMMANGDTKEYLMFLLDIVHLSAVATSDIKVQSAYSGVLTQINESSNFECAKKAVFSHICVQMNKVLATASLNEFLSLVGLVGKKPIMKLVLQDAKERDKDLRTWLLTYGDLPKLILGKLSLLVDEINLRRVQEALILC